MEEEEERREKDDDDDDPKSGLDSKANGEEDMEHENESEEE